MKLLHAARPAAMVAILVLLLPTLSHAQATNAVVQEALRAAPKAVAAHAAVMDWEQNVLREGTNGWTCFPSPPNVADAPMCLDEAWLSWAHGWLNRSPVETTRVGVAYMLQGDGGSSNIDPFAEGLTADNQWVVEGPHLMIIVPDADDLEGIPTDPENGGPYVMWKGTPYAHIMIPIR